MIVKKYIFLSIIFLGIGICSFGQINRPIRIKAPDKQTVAELGVNKQGQLQYRVLFSGQEAISWSDLGLQLDQGVVGRNTVITGRGHRFNKEKFAWSLGENDTIVNCYNELTLSCASSSLKYRLIVRVFDGSVAFRYDVPEQDGIAYNRIRRENTSFNFTQPSVIYHYNHESAFTPTPVDSLTKTCDLPATLKNGKFYFSVGEAENDWYTKTELRKGEKPNSLAIAFVKDSAVNVSGSFRTPWRTISISKTATGLHKFSDLYLRLTQTSVKEVPKWIKPGKLIRSQLNTQSGLDCIDFATKHNFQYIMFDAGWYGAEFRSSSDPTKVIPAIDMPAVIQHGKDKGIGIILYVNYVGLRAKLDTILPLYKKWGISGFKFGFVDGVKQEGINWLASAIQKVNDYGFILNIHDNYKPTGLSRRFPALLTQEGIRGDENSPDAFHNTVLPYTRFLSGPADFTFCYPNSKETFSKNLKVSKAQQLALTVIYFSPLQAIFWYGKPNDYTNEEEIEFFSYVPTVWNESHYLAGDIGENISVARRNGETWYIGIAAGFKDWKNSIRLDFLSPGQKYMATVYEDDNNGTIRKRMVNLKKGDEFPFEITAKGGQAIIVRPSGK